MTFAFGLAACSGGDGEPAEGTEGGPCRSDNTCDAGLECVNGTCEVPGAECQSGDSQDCYCTGGAQGTQNCQGDGTWADCVCDNYCGDSTCDAGEDWISCPADCPSQCGNQVCDPAEDEFNCPQDCQGTQECDLQTGHSSCDSCINTSCLTSCTACADSADCTSLWNCVRACQDASCIQNCQSQYPNGQTLLAAFAGPSGCMGTLCTVSCGNDCGNGTCDPGEDSVSCPDDCEATTDCDHLTGETQCDQCLETSCSAYCQACYANTDCWALMECLSNCGSDIPCIQQCTSEHSLGMSEFNDFLGPGGCAETNCSTYCQ